MKRYRDTSAWYRGWKFWVYIAAGVVIVLACVWLFLQVKDVPTWSLVPDSSFAFVSISLKSESKGASAFLESMRDWMLKNEPNRFRRAAIKTAFSSFLPERIIAVAVPGGEGEKPESILIVKMGCVAHLIRIFDGNFSRSFFGEQDIEEEKVRGHRVLYTESEEGRMGLRAFTIIGRTMVAASSYTTLEDALTAYPQQETAEATPLSLTPIVLQGVHQQSIIFFADNGSRYLSKLEAYIEEKYAFAPFPSMDSVELMFGSVELTEGEVKGVITVLGNDPDRLREIRSDVKYLHGAIRRKLRPSNIDMEADIQVQHSRVQFTFSVPSYIEAMLNTLEEK
jgi:hypothetical protein